MKRFDSFRHLKVLFVDAHMDSSINMVKVLRRYFKDIVHFECALQAFEHLMDNHHEYDLVISEFIFPRMEGFDFVNNIRMNICHELPILIVSGHENSVQLKSFDNLEMLMKPVVFEELYEKLDKLLYI